MSFATEIERAASHRFALLRLTGARYLTTDLTSIGGGKYTYDFGDSVVPSGLTKNSSASGLTQKTTAAAVASPGDWHVDEETGLVTLYPTGSYDPDTDHYVLTYYLFFSSSTEATSAPETPTDTSSTVRPWEPRIIGTPTVPRDMTNELAGVLTIADTSVDIDNTDRALNRWLTGDDSFNERSAELYFCINELTNVSVAYRGRVVRVDLNAESVSFTITDSFSALTKPAYMGDSYEECVFLRSEYPDLNPLHEFRPCRYIVGWSSRYDMRIRGATPAIAYYGLHHGSGASWGDFFEEATNVEFSTTAGTSTNREWVLCRVPAGKLRVISYGTGVRTDMLATDSYVQMDDNNLVLGHRFTYDSGSNEATIRYNEPFTGGSADLGTAGTDYNLYVDVDGDGYIYPALPPVFAHTDATVVPADGAYDVHLYLVQGGIAYPLVQDRDFTVSVTATSGGNELVSVTLADNFEGTYSLSAFNPDTDKIFYRVTTENGDNTHADVIQALCEKAGMSVDSASFAAAASALDADCMFSIPQYDENDYGRYLDYVQNVLDGTMGVVALNSDGEVTYNLLAAPTPSVTRTSDETLGVTVELDYEDIVTSVSAYNPHNQSAKALEDADGPTQLRSNDRARHLHNTTKTLNLRHVLEKIGNRIDDIMSVRSERRAIYTYKTATADLVVEVGDEVALESDRIPGTATSADLQVVGFSRSMDDVTIKATDVRGL